MNIKKINQINSLQFSGNAYIERNEFRKIYKELWKELNLSPELQPPLFFKDMQNVMSFSPTDYAIYVNKNISRNILNLRNKNGRNKATLRHEIEHVKQIWDIIRLKGAKQFVDDLDIESKTKIKRFVKIEKLLGNIEPNSEQGLRAQKYYKNLLNYPNLEKFYGVLDVQYLIDCYKYYTSILEIDAKKAERPYRPSLYKRLNIYIKTQLEMLKEGINPFITKIKKINISKK